MSEETKLELVGEENTEDQIDYKAEEDALRIEFQKAVESSAEQRANSPFMAAAQQHHRMSPIVMKEIDELTSADLKRILKYICFYPFYVKELGVTEGSHVESVAAAADKLVQSKFTMSICMSLEKEIRVSNAIAAEEAKIEPLNLDSAGGQITEEVLNNAADVALNKIGE